MSLGGFATGSGAQLDPEFVERLRTEYAEIEAATRAAAGVKDADEPSTEADTAPA